MIEYIQGIIAADLDNGLVVDIGGVGIRALCSTTTVEKLRKDEPTVKLYTRLVIRENNPPELFGFSSMKERTMFDLLCAVKGVSGRIALSMLSHFPAQTVANLIASQEGKSLQMVSGVGKKLAERIVVELKERVVDTEFAGDQPDSAPLNSLAEDVILGLVSLGYKPNQARVTVLEYLEQNSQASDAGQVIQTILKNR